MSFSSGFRPPGRSFSASPWPVDQSWRPSRGGARPCHGRICTYHLAAKAKKGVMDFSPDPWGRSVKANFVAGFFLEELMLVSLMRS